MIKKITVLLLLAEIAGVANAKLRVGPTAGVNFSSLYWKQHLLKVDGTVGADAGLMAEIMIPGIGFGVDASLLYNMHGGRVHFGDRFVWSSSGIGTENVVLHTVQIPINLRFKYTRLQGFEDYLAPLVYAGPVFSFTAGHNRVEPLAYTSGYVGVQCGIGVELFRHTQLSGGYYWGLTREIKTLKLVNFSARPQGWNIRLTYLF